MKLNVGCGTDYRDGFVNIDGSDTLERVDRVIDISTESLLKFFERDSIEYILAQDIIEHHYHWEAIELLTQFHGLLQKGGVVEIRVPDSEYIINSWRIPLARKLVLLYGGQDIPQGTDAEMDASRKQFPQYFCHKYGWTRTSMTSELVKIGFSNVRTARAGTNFVTHAVK